MLEIIVGTLTLGFGTALVWVSLNITHFLTRLVRPARPPGFVALHMTAVWSVGVSSALCGIALIYEGLAYLQAANS